MHPNNPILAGKTCDQRLDRVGIGKIFKDGRGGFLHVAIGMAKNLHEHGYCGSAYFSERRSRRLAYRSILVMKCLHQRGHCPRIGEIPEQHGSFFTQCPVLILQRSDFFTDAITHFQKISA